MTEPETPDVFDLRSRPYYYVEGCYPGVELLLNGEVICVMTVGEATAFGAELIRMAAMAESEAHFDLGYRLTGRDLPTRELLNGMVKSARFQYYQPMPNPAEVIDGEPATQEREPDPDHTER